MVDGAGALVDFARNKWLSIAGDTIDIFLGHDPVGLGEGEAYLAGVVGI